MSEVKRVKKQLGFMYTEPQQSLLTKRDWSHFKVKDFDDVKMDSESMSKGSYLNLNSSNFGLKKLRQAKSQSGGGVVDGGGDSGNATGPLKGGLLPQDARGMNAAQNLENGPGGVAISLGGRSQGREDVGAPGSSTKIEKLAKILILRKFNFFDFSLLFYEFVLKFVAGHPGDQFSTFSQQSQLKFGRKSKIDKNSKQKGSNHSSYAKRCSFEEVDQILCEDFGKNKKLQKVT